MNLSILVISYQPYGRLTSSYLVLIFFILLLQWRKLLSQIDNVFVFIIPAIEQREFINDLILCFFYCPLLTHLNILTALCKPTIKASISSFVLYMAKEALVVPGMR